MQVCQLLGFKVKSGGLLLACFFILNHAWGQTPGKVEVIKDPQIDSLIARRIALGKAGPGNISSAGFRIQIFSGSERQEAYNAQSRFKSLYPLINTYISYTEPNYKVLAGDFRTRMEAQKLMNSLRAQFPSLIIIPGKINSNN